MGASYNMTTMPKSADVRAKFKEIQDQDLFDNGHSYSGGFGMAQGLVLRPETFATIADADEWLQDHAQKWGSALAVSVGDVLVIGAWCAS